MVVVVGGGQTREACSRHVPHTLPALLRTPLEKALRNGAVNVARHLLERDDSAALVQAAPLRLHDCVLSGNIECLLVALQDCRKRGALAMQTALTAKVCMCASLCSVLAARRNDSLTPLLSSFRTLMALVWPTTPAPTPSPRAWHTCLMQPSGWLSSWASVPVQQMVLPLPAPGRPSAPEMHPACAPRVATLVGACPVKCWAPLPHPQTRLSTGPASTPQPTVAPPSA